MVPSGRGLACGLQDQRLMARPPARAGGRSGLLTGGESGNPNGYSLPFSQRVPSHIPSPPSRWAGRYGPFTVRAAGQVSCKKYGLPHIIPPEKSPEEEPLPSGFFPHFFPRNGAPGWASHRSPPFQRRRNCPPLPEKPEAAARFPRGGFFHFSLFADLDEAQ